MRLTLAAAALALLCACGRGYTNGSNSLPDGAVPVGAGGSGGGGGQDAGDGGDAGSDGGLDGGCVAGFQGAAQNGCSGISPFSEPINLTVNPANCSAAFALQEFPSNCTGAVAGANNAFSGTCGSYSCTAPSLPGGITCARPAQGACTIVVCDAGTCP